MTGFVLKGALVEFMPTFLPIPLPNVIVFQYNPEKMTHTWTQPEAARTGGPETSNPLAVRGMPGETFSFTIAIDAYDEIADGSAPAAALAAASGIYSRLAALEMLLYPASKGQPGLTGAVSAAVSSALSGAGSGPARQVPQSVMPVTLFIWGPGRIVPVRVTGLTITENCTTRRSTRPTPKRNSRSGCSPRPNSSRPRPTMTSSATSPRSPIPTRSRSARRSRPPISRTRPSRSSG